MKVTKDFLNKGRSVNGGWSKAQLSLLGIHWPADPGWQLRVDGQEISDEWADRFLALKDRHIQERAQLVNDTLSKPVPAAHKAARRGNAWCPSCRMKLHIDHKLLYHATRARCHHCGSILQPTFVMAKF